ncbi:hypothetical protein HN385_01955 [archaeon]|nr:hypothetical protein [archaeon]MBT7192616.1 hypothetical protein [archaeon]MBT7507931.1 hypothetical protein [archaeon]
MVFNTCWVKIKSIKLEFKILLACLIILFSLQLIFFHHTIDDSFISFRYSENLVNHGELNWNVGENPVEGYSNFLWVILATLPLIFGLNIYLFMKIVGMIFGLMSVIAIYKLSKELSPNLNWYPPLFLSLSYPFALWSVSAMETSFFTFLLIISIYYFVVELRFGKGYKSSILFLCLALTRSEGVILFIISLSFRLFYIYMCERNKLQKTKGLIYKLINTLKKNIVWILIFVIPYLIYFFWRWNYYGFFFPNTYYVKNMPFGGLNYIIGTVLIFSPFILIGLFYFMKNKNWKWTYIFMIQFFFFLTFLNINPIMGNILRYVIPILPFFALPIPFIFGESIVRKNKLLKMFFLIFCVCILGVNFINFSNNYEITKTYVLNIENVNIPLGISFSDKNLTVALGDCGIIPFYSKSSVIDLLALNNEFLAHNGFSSEYVINERPDVIILRVASDDKEIFFPFDSVSALIYENDLLHEFYELNQIIPMFKQVEGNEYWYWVYYSKY